MYIIAEGDLPICLLAHMDTVFKYPPKTFYYDQEQNVLWSPHGLGADDRAGIIIIMELIERGYRPHIILTDLEERGGIGAGYLISSYPECPFKECKALIQLDRQGHDDAVYYECGNEDYEKLITSYGFVTEIGSFSDISIIAPQWEIAAVNLSVGYEREHTYTETLNITWMNETINKVEWMLVECGEWSFYSYIPIVYDDNNNLFNFIADGKCTCCNEIYNAADLNWYSTTGKAVDAFPICNKCYEEYFGSPEDE